MEIYITLTRKGKRSGSGSRSVYPLCNIFPFKYTKAYKEAGDVTILVVLYLYMFLSLEESKYQAFSFKLSSLVLLAMFSNLLFFFLETYYSP